jgi:acetyl-CoA carboxylase carboxyltransferase component
MFIWENLKCHQNQKLLIQQLGLISEDVLEFKHQNSSLEKKYFRHFKINSKFPIYISEMNMNGGLLTFDNENLELFKNFALESCLEKRNGIFILLIRTGGVRITHNRSIFKRVWGVVPALFKMRKQHLFLSCALDKCLGAGAVYFAQADFRLAIGDNSIINLTGPGVMSNFFGQSKEAIDYSEYASVLHQFSHNDLIQEHYENLNLAVHRIKNILMFLTNTNCVLNEKAKINIQDPKVFSKAIEDTENFIQKFADQKMELFPQISPISPTYIIKINGQYFGLLTQLFKNPHNLIDNAMVKKWTMSLKIFKNLKLPLISCLDSPGADPRQEESDQNLLLNSMLLVESMIDYPYKKIGIILNRSFGGSGIFSLLKEHGSSKLVALKDTKLGVMGDNVLERLAEKHPKLRAEWEQTKNYHHEDLSDLVQDQILDDILSINELKNYILTNLSKEKENEQLSYQVSTRKNRNIMAEVQP